MTGASNDRLAKEVARSLLQINAIKLNTEQSFTWASGLKAPIYCDNRRILSYPDLRRKLASDLAQKATALFSGLELIAGVATGAIAMGVLVAEELNLPFVYVRSSPKEHGLGSRIEGHASKGMKTLVIEDLVSTAGSSLSAVRALRADGLDVLGMLAIFSYGLDVARRALHEARCPFYSLSNLDALLVSLKEQGGEITEHVPVLCDWQKDPIKWSASAGQ